MAPNNYNAAPGQIYNSGHSLFHQYKYKDVMTNLNAMKGKTSSKQDMIEFDENAVLRKSKAYPRNVFTNQGSPCSDTSDTKNLLEKMQGI